MMETWFLAAVSLFPVFAGRDACDFMNARKNVLVEKTMAASLEECDKMIETERRTDMYMGVIV